MSASREKNNRRNNPVTKAAPAEKKTMPKAAKKALIIAGVVLAVAAVIFFAMMNSGFFTTHATAAVVSGHKITPAEYRYYMYDTVYQYNDYLSMMGVDTQTPLSEQIYDESTGETWADYFGDLGLANAAGVYALCDEAEANGFTLSEEAQQELDQLEDTLAIYGMYSGYANNGNQYLQSRYGEFSNVKTYQKYMKAQLLATEYSQKVAEGFTYSDAQLAAEYAADPTKYDTVDYRSFSVTNSIFEEKDESKLAELKKATAEKIAEAAKGGEQAFVDAVVEAVPEASKEVYAEPSATLHRNTGIDSVVTLASDWLFDAARQEGDTTVIDADGYYLVVYFIAHHDQDFQLPNLRVIPFAVSDMSDELALAQANDQAKGLMDTYNMGTKGADAFMALDTANAAFIENVTPGADSAELDEWAFNTHHLEGDVAVVTGNSAVYLVYFDGFGENYREMLTENALRTADYNAWYSEITGGAEYTVKSFGKFFV